MKPNKKIKLIFATTAGDFEDEFPINQPLRAVKTQVMAKVGLNPSTADDFIVTLGGNPLNEDQKLGEIGLEDCTVLTIERKAIVKIANACDPSWQ